MQIGDLLRTNRGLCDEEVEEWMKENEEKKVYELLVIKKELSETKEYPDVSVVRWFRG
jgi:translation initiation factor IF-2